MPSTEPEQNPATQLSDRTQCPHPGCDDFGSLNWSGFCGPEHRERHFEKLGAGNVLPIMWPDLDKHSAED